MGYAIGIATGLAIGLTTARKQKSWPELTTRERKMRIGLIISGAALLIAGIITFVLVT